MTDRLQLFWFRRLALRVVAKLVRRVHGSGPLIVAIGDSHTDPGNTYTAPWNVWLRHVGARGYRTVNLGVSGATTRDMRLRVAQALDYGPPAAVIVFGGVNDAVMGFDPEETAGNIRYILRWLHDHGVPRVMLIGTPHVNWTRPADWWDGSLLVRGVLRDAASECGVLFLDLGAKQEAMIERGEAPDFRNRPYRQDVSWHVRENNQHFNARGHKLVADTVADALALLLA